MSGACWPIPRNIWETGLSGGRRFAALLSASAAAAAVAAAARLAAGTAQQPSWAERAEAGDSQVSATTCEGRKAGARG
jgi:hypothetical protein